MLLSIQFKAEMFVVREVGGNSHCLTTITKQILETIPFMLM